MHLEALRLAFDSGAETIRRSPVAGVDLSDLLALIQLEPKGIGTKGSRNGYPSYYVQKLASLYRAQTVLHFTGLARVVTLLRNDRLSPE